MGVWERACISQDKEAAFRLIACHQNLETCPLQLPSSPHKHTSWHSLLFLSLQLPSIFFPLPLFSPFFFLTCIFIHSLCSIKPTRRAGPWKIQEHSISPVPPDQLSSSLEPSTLEWGFPEAISHILILLIAARGACVSASSSVSPQVTLIVLMSWLHPSLYPCQCMLCNSTFSLQLLKQCNWITTANSTSLHKTNITSKERIWGWRLQK